MGLCFVVSGQEMVLELMFPSDSFVQKKQLAKQTSSLKTSKQLTVSVYDFPVLWNRSPGRLFQAALNEEEVKLYRIMAKHPGILEHGSHKSFAS